jgi:hypothetical protein
VGVPTVWDLRLSGQSARQMTGACPDRGLAPGAAGNLDADMQDIDLGEDRRRLRRVVAMARRRPGMSLSHPR